ncbi:hypothetical protein GH5_03727 [Leishmania sp. Ghana 2012 LV757]|uniref:hypothetical protein n=1 Tax=Leishmania sp. Ghana 2012 LV757 TaxID=2803181 RepID=UPI001B3CC207|nr:hypothetical protein GH5_03727 [Leishmania sp. Ghana 2012 LV757]
MRATVSPSFSVVTATPAAAAASVAWPVGIPSCRPSSSLVRLFKATGARWPATSVLTRCRYVHIGHSTDVHRWRNAEKEEVQRQFRGGVKLGSDIVKMREQAAKEKELIDQDKFTDWRLVYNYAIGAALLLIGLNVILAFVEPNPSPEYVPYTESVVQASSASEAATSREREQRAESEAGCLALGHD